MTGDRFSDRAGVHRRGDPLRDSVPERVRVAVTHFISSVGQSYSGENHRDAFWSQVVLRLERGLDVDLPMPDYLNSYRVEQWLARAEWFDFLTACEIVYRYLAGDDSEEIGMLFREKLNSALNRYGSPYTLTEQGEVVDSSSGPADEAIEDARALLADEAFEGADRQFQAALASYRSRPIARDEQAIASAIGAVEGVLRVVLSDRTIKFGPAIARVKNEHGLHPALASSLDKLNGYASDAGGRHGTVGKPDADHVIAEFCLHQSAAAIVFLARLYGYDVQRGPTE